MGCVTFGREIDESASFKMMDYALEKGIVLFDTAAAYAGGESERILGNWLQMQGSAADPVIVCTKVLPPYTPENIRASLEESLKRLKKGRIDVYYFHSWHPTCENPDVLGTLQAFVEAGVIGRVGASNFSFEQLRKVVDVQRAHGFSTVGMIQNNHNLAVRDVGEDLVRFCREEDIDIVTYSPLGAGFLTGKHKGGVKEGSRFDIIPGHQQVYFNESAESGLKRLLAVSEKTGLSPVHLALAWALHQRGTASVLVGGRTPASLEQGLAAEAYDDPEVFARLEGVEFESQRSFDM